MTVTLTVTVTVTLTVTVTVTLTVTVTVTVTMTVTVTKRIPQLLCHHSTHVVYGTREDSDTGLQSTHSYTSTSRRSCARGSESATVMP